MVCCMTGCFQYLIWKANGFELFGINRNEPVKIFLSDSGIPVISVTEQRKDLTEQPCTKRRTASFKGILSAFQAFNCLRMKDHLGIRYRKNLIQKSGMIVMCVRQEYISDLFRLNMSFFSIFIKCENPPAYPVSIII